jgi:hypothetical protein
MIITLPLSSSTRVHAIARKAFVPEAEMLRRRLMRLLRGRTRYRYVRPEVKVVEEGLLVRSPCCSRKVDAEGGIIDIALLRCQDGVWQLYAKDHAAACWKLLGEGTDLPVLIKPLLSDPDRIFWP